LQRLVPGELVNVRLAMTTGANFLAACSAAELLVIDSTDVMMDQP
jgi:hypothetical protein